MKNKWSILVTACLLLSLLAVRSDETGSTIPEEASSATTEAAVQETAQPNPEQADSTGEEAVQSASAAEETVQPDLTISMPLTEDEVSFTLWHDFVPLLSDWTQGMQDNLSYATMEEISGVHMEFTNVSKDSAATAVSLWWPPETIRIFGTVLRATTAKASTPPSTPRSSMIWPSIRT